MSNKNLQTNTTSALHNPIMEAGGKDHPPMFAHGNYVQWKFGIKRYIDTKPNHELIHYCLTHEPYKYQFKVPSATTATPGIDGLIMWKAIERLKQELEVVSDEEATPRDKEIEKLMALISMSFKKIYKPTNNNLRTSSNTRNKIIDNTSRSDRRIGYDRQTRRYKNHMAVNVARARDNVVNWMDDTHDATEDQELEAHYMYMTKIQEVNPDAADNSRPIFNTKLLEKDEHDLLDSLIELMKLEIDGSKKINKSLESSNKALREANMFLL
ncbi:hypothetical protein Tco_0209390 [Tanacetum coccineum]